MNELKNKTEVFKLKGSLITVTILQLSSFDLEAFENQLQMLVEKTPKFFEHMPLIFDLQALPEHQAGLNFATLMQVCKHFKIVPIGIRNASPLLESQALAAELAIFPVSKKDMPFTAVQQILPKTKITTEDAEQQTQHPPAKIIDHPIRSGQQIYAKHQDLIVLNSVSAGAEVLADGNIHIYGTLRGRALAGIQGYQQARIFCHKLSPELISIAGFYQLNDHLLHEANHPVQIYLENERLQIKAL